MSAEGAANIIMTWHSIIFQRSWWWEVHDGWKEIKCHPCCQEVQREGSRELVCSSSSWSLKRWWRKYFWKSFLNTWRTRRWSWIFSMDLLMGNHAWQAWTIKQWVWWMRGEYHISIMSLIRIFTVSYSSFIDKLMRYGLPQHTVQWTENWLNCSNVCEQHKVQLEASH